MIISIIVAVATNRVIGCKNRLIWHIGADLRRFKSITSGHPVIMGRKTFESLGRPLPNRHNIVITRSDTFAAEGITVVHSLEQAFALYTSQPNTELFVIGGGEIYRQALPLADRLYITAIDATPEGDTLFPEVSPTEWRPVWREDHPRTAENPEENPIGFEFIDYIRVSAPSCNR